MRQFGFLVALLVLGCGEHNPGKNPELVEISGRVTMRGHPVSGVILNLQPTSGGMQATLPLKNGVFKGHATPGRYTYYITEGSSPDWFRAVPEKYHLGDKERQIDVDACAVLTIRLD